MIHDAQTNPRGRRLSITAWPRDPSIRSMARRLGYRIPAPAFTAPEATPARALLNHGVWRAWCPDCPFAAEDVWRGHNLFWCMRCGNAKIGHAWRPLVWPENRTEIETALADYPSVVQHWEPWGPAVDIVAEAEAWLAKAAAMVDPEHGLTDNEVGGADDPESYTTPVIAVTNELITAADANVDKGDIRYFRQFMPANPSGSGYVLESSSADAAAWVQANAAKIISWLGYTPFSDAGDSATGVSVFTNSTTSSPLGTQNTNVTGTAVGFYILNAAANAFELLVRHTSIEMGGASQPVAIGGALSAASAAITNAISAASATLSGALSAASATISGLVTASRFESTVSTGTAPFTVASTTEVANLNAAALSGNDWKQGSTGEFAGTQALTTSYADLSSPCQFTADRNGQWFVIAHGEFGGASGEGPPWIKIVSGGVDQEEGKGGGAAGTTFATTAMVTALVTISGSTTVKVQVKKDSGAGVSNCTYTKITGFWLAP